MNFIFKFFLTFNSTSTMIVVYLIKEQYYLLCLEGYPKFISYIVFLIIPPLLTLISLWMKIFLTQDEINFELESVEEANDAVDYLIEIKYLCGTWGRVNRNNDICISNDFCIYIFITDFILQSDVFAIRLQILLYNDC